ncbi:calcium-binding protein [Stenotrophomonas oahuensis]|uniref:Calcium-binding protein n=1 Tax=Stenotrophomonas oahuensis TaxID=3003271 RepID=A0ABY9YW98_9GAMM|nr:calcium-binding protein [Stenotrophomonas sp. A5586]WNH54449.1 calcium-binding protein [Stenotrophomonas sp. A5586]
MTHRRWIAALLLALASSLSHATPPDVYQDIAEQIRTRSGDHRLLVLGELHGTRETPLLVQALVVGYVDQGIPLQLALELPEAENAALATYMASTGDAAANQALRTSPYWNVKDHLHDGRRSQDMLDLIEAARALRAQGRDVSVVGFDANPTGERAPGARDADMAKTLRAGFQALPANGRMIVLTGNMHGSRESYGLIDYPPATALLTDLPLYNVRIEAQRGEFWACMGYRKCGTRNLITRDVGSPRAYNDPDRDYDLWVFLPRFTVARLLDAGD